MVPLADMSVATVLLDGCFALLLAVATFRLPEYWRAPQSAAQIPTWWVWRGRSYLGFLQARPVSIAFGWVVVVLVATGSNLSKEGTTTITIVAAVSAALFVALGLCVVSVGLSGHPRFLIPPWLRNAG